MSKHFALSSELSGAIAKRLPHTKISFLRPAVSSINSLQIDIYIYKRASLACAAQLADTLCPPEAPYGRLGSPLFSYIGDNISKYVCLTVITDIARKITKFVNFLNF